jgi:hypothetical protein
MKLGLISDNNVVDKAVYTAKISEYCDYNNIEEFNQLALNFHFCCGVFTDNIRDTGLQDGHMDHFKYIDVIQYDFDCGTITAECVHNTLIGVRHSILASKNNMRDKGDGKGIIERFHLFCWTSEPITDMRFYKFIVKDMAVKYNWSNDRSCCDVTRYFHKHKEVLFINDTNELDIVEYNKLYDKFKRNEQTMQFINKLKALQYNADNDPVNKFKHSKYFEVLKSLATPGPGRYGKANEVIGGMKACGVLSEDAIALFDVHTTYGTSGHYNRSNVCDRIAKWL